MRGAGLRSADACSTMHNSAFHLPLAALVRSTLPVMSHHNKRFTNHLNASHTHAHTRSDNRVVSSNFKGLKITHTYAHLCILT